MKSLTFSRVLRNTLLVLSLLFVGTFAPSFVDALTVSPVRIEVALDAGEIYEGSYRLTNDSSSARTYFSSFQNFRANGETGTPYFVEESTQLASWLDGPDAITLAPYEAREIPFSITLPEDIESGGYFAASFWMTSPSNVSGNGSVSSVSFRIGILIMLRVNGDITEDGGVIDFVADKDFMTNIPLGVTYRFQNDGRDRLNPKGLVRVKNMFDRVVHEFDANPQLGNILPESRRQFDLVWSSEVVAAQGAPDTFFEHVKTQWQDWYMGPYTLELDVTYGNDATLSDTKELKVLVLPIHFLSLVLGFLLFVFILYRLIKIAIKKAVKKQLAKLAELSLSAEKKDLVDKEPASEEKADEDTNKSKEDVVDAESETTEEKTRDKDNSETENTIELVDEQKEMLVSTDTDTKKEHQE